VYLSIHCPFSTAVQTEDTLYSSFAKFQNEAITMAIVMVSKPFYHTASDVPVGHSTG
jgi:hypothetical protein